MQIDADRCTIDDHTSASHNQGACNQALTSVYHGTYTWSTHRGSCDNELQCLRAHKPACFSLSQYEACVLYGLVTNRHCRFVSLTLLPEIVYILESRAPQMHLPCSGRGSFTHDSYMLPLDTSATCCLVLVPLCTIAPVSVCVTVSVCVRSHF